MVQGGEEQVVNTRVSQTEVEPSKWDAAGGADWDHNREGVVPVHNRGFVHVPRAPSPFRRIGYHEQAAHPRCILLHTRCRVFLSRIHRRRLSCPTLQMEEVPRNRDHPCLDRVHALSVHLCPPILGEECSARLS